MNWDQVEGNWKQLKGKVRSQWGKLTDDDVDIVNGRRTELLGIAAMIQGATAPGLGGPLGLQAHVRRLPWRLVRPREDEWLCTKARASAFYGTSLDAHLRIHRVQSLIVCGGSTSGCVRASCVDAFSAGFQVIAVEDGCFDRARTPHLANLFDLHAKYATVLTADEVIAELRRKEVAA